MGLDRVDRINIVANAVGADELDETANFLVDKLRAVGFASAGGTETLVLADPGFIAGEVKANTGYTATLQSFEKGAFAHGYVFAYSAAAKIDAKGQGSFAQGFSYNGTIYAPTTGSFAQGYARNGGILESGSSGTFSQGFVAGYGAYHGEINAQQAGTFAQGYCESYGGNAFIRATANGAFARGWTTDYAITASGKGSFAQGYASTGDIVASADGAVQFGQGTNALAQSLQVGAAPRLCSGGNPAGSVQNGDIWVAANYVYIRSNGADIKIVSCAA